MLPSIPCSRALLLVLLLLVPAAARADGAASGPANSFDDYVHDGDRERAMGRLEVAVYEYETALALRDDPTVKGRVGLLFAELGKPARAANYLREAVFANGGATDKERALFEAKLAELRRRVAMLDVWLNVDHAVVTIDKEPPFPVSGRGWWRFVAPGEHEILVEERGYAAERQRFRTEAGKELSLHVDLRKVGEEERAPEEVEAPKVEAPKVATREEPVKELAPARSAAGIVVYQQPQREVEAQPETPERRWAIGAGAVGIFGATPGGAAGPTLSVERRWDWVRVTVDARLGIDPRAAWAFGGIDKAPPMDLAAWSVTAGVCGAWRRTWFACAVGQVDGLVVLGGPYRLDRSGVMPGAGLRAGADVPVTGPLSIRFWGDFVGHPNDRSIQALQYLWTGYALNGAFGAAGLVAF
jgi:hypothetical protein